MTTYRAAGVPARAVDFATIGSGNIVVPSWSKPAAALFNGTTMANFALPSGLVSALGPHDLGFSSVTPDGGTGVWFVSYSGVLAHLDQTGALVGSLYTLPKGETYIGLALRSSTPYVAAASGRVFTLSSVPAVTEVSANFGTQVWSLTSDGSVLYAATASAGVLKLTFSAFATATLSTAFTNTATATYGVDTSSYGTVAVGSFPQTVGPANLSGLGFNPTTPTIGAGSSSASNNVTILAEVGLAAGASVAVTGAGPLAWTPNGSQILVTCPSQNHLVVLSATSTPTVTQTLTLTGPGQLAILSDSSEALIVQSTGVVAIYTNTAGVWAAASTVSVPGALSIILTDDSTAHVGTATAVVTLVRAGATWSVASSLTVGFPASSLSVAVGGDIGVAGAASGTGHVAVIRANAVAGSTTWSGGATAVLALPGEVYVLDAAASLLRAFGTASGKPVSAQATTAVPASGVGFAHSANYFYVFGATAQAFTIGKPYTINPVRTGAVFGSIGGTFATYPLAQGKIPAGVAWGPSGVVSVVTDDNTLLTFNGATAGALTLTTTATVPEPPGQAAGIPVGISHLQWVGSVLYGTSCLSDTFTRLN